jgi:hypothetical protein
LPLDRIGGKGCGSHEEAPRPECTVYVRGIEGTNADEGAIKQSLKECFSDKGEVVRIQLPFSRETGALKGYGFVHFRDLSSAAAVLKLGKACTFTLLGKLRTLQIRALQPIQSSRRADNDGAAAGSAAVAQAERHKELRNVKRRSGIIVAVSSLPPEV